MATLNNVITNANGNVGIGTTIPATKLDVKGNVFVANAANGNNTIAFGNIGGLGPLNGAPDNLNGSSFLVVSSSTASGAPSHMKFFTTTGGVCGERMRIAADGNVSIGTTSAAYKLDLNGTFRATETATLAAVSITGTINSNTTEALRISNNDGYISIYNTAGTTRTGYIQGITANSLTIAAENSSILQFNVAGSEKVRINTVGNVGIGTTTGTFVLNVYNNADVWHARFGSATGELRIGGQTNSGAVIQSFIPGSGTVRDLYLQRDGGNVGIGTNSPIRLLQVNGDSLIYANVSGAVNSNKLIFGSFANSSAAAVYAQTTTATSGDLILAATVSSTITEFVRVQSTGNVGIGTSTPLAKLHVTGSSSVPAALFFGNVGIGTTSFVYGAPTRGLLEIYGSAESLIALKHATGNLYIQKTSVDTYINNSGAGFISIATNTSERMRIASNGNVGIGTTSPTQKLHVDGNVLSSYNILTSVVKISSASDAASYISVDGYTAGLSYAGTYIGLASLVGFSVSANLYIGGGFPVISAGWTGTISGIAYANATSLASSVLLQTSPDGSTWTTRSQTGAINGTETLTYSVADSATPLYVRFTLRQESGGTVAANNCNIQNIIITNLPSLPNKPSISNRFLVNGSGNIGIGTTTPVSKFEMVGGEMAVKLGANTTSSFQWKNSSGTKIQEIRYDDSDGSMTLGGVGGYPIKFITSNTEKVRISGTGNVGIGTTTTTSGLLTLHGTYPQLVANNPTTGSGVVIQLKDNGRDAGFIGHSTTTSRLQFGSKGIANTQMTLDANGNLGIGITSPVAKLDVNGTSNFAANVYHSIGGQKFFAGSGGTYGYIYTGTTALNFINGNDTSTLMTLLNGGNVGIGTTSPGALLQVHGSNPFFRISNSASADQGIKITYGDSDTHGLHLLYNASSALSYIDNTYPIDAAQVWGDILFRQNVASTMTTRMIIKANSGNVGIGTTSPAAKLYVVSSGSPIARFDGSSVASSGATEIDVLGPQSNGDLNLGVGGSTFTDDTNNIQNKGYVTAAGGLSALNLRSDSGYVQITTGGITSANERMRITSDGKVGIGTSSPLTKLVVSNGSNENFEFGPGDASLNGGYIEYINRNSGSTRPDFNFYLGGGGGSFKFYTNGTNERMRITSAGNVGIGTTSPSSAVSFNKVVEAYDATSLSYQVNSGGTYKAEFGISSNGGWLGTSTAHAMRFASNGTERMRISGSGTIQLNTLATYSSLTYEPSIIYTRVGQSGIGGIYFGNSYNSNNNVGMQLRVSNDGTQVQAVTINNQGCVGIGTTNPIYKFQVVGSAYVNNGTLYIDSGNSLTWGNSTQSILGTNDVGLSFVAGSTTRMFVSSGGNIGIGTTVPAALLNIRASAPTGTGAVTTGTNVLVDSNTNNYITFRNTSDNGTYAGLVFLDNNVGGYIAYGNSGAAVGSDSMIYGAYNDHIFQNGYVNETLYNRTETMRIKQNGNVGIGTTSPSATMDISKAAGNYIFDLTNATEVGFKLRTYNSGSTTLNTKTFTQGLVYNGNFNSGINYYRGSGGTDGYLSFSTSGTERMMLDKNGNIGIGTTTTAARLHVNSTTAGATLLRTDGTSGTLFSVVDDLSDSLMSVNNSAGLPVFEVFADDRIVAGQYGKNDLVVINNKVGIGTNNPIGKLHVTGSTSIPAAVLLGDVGIGTTAPTAQANYRFLQVNGPVSAIIETMVGGTRIGGFDSTSNTLYVGSIGSFPVVFRTAVDEKMRISANGNVGIGTTSPTQKLEVNGTIKATSFVGSFSRTSTTQTITGNSALTIDVSAAYIHIITVVASGGVFGISSVTYNNRKAGPEVDEIILIFKWPASGSGTITISNTIGDIPFNYGKATVSRLTSYKGTTGLWIAETVASNIDYTNL